MLLTVLIDDGAFGVDAMPSGWGAILPHCVTLRRKKPLYTSAEGGVALYKSLTPSDAPGTKSSSRANISAGVLESMLIVTPFDMIKTRLQKDGGGQGAVQRPRHLLANEGVTALWKGDVPTMLRQACNFTVFAIDELEPVSVHGQEPKYKGFVHAIGVISNAEGYMALWKGLCYTFLPDEYKNSKEVPHCVKRSWTREQQAAAPCMFSRRASIEPIGTSREEASPPRRHRRASAGEVFAPLLSLLGVPPASSAMSMSAPPTTQSRRKTTNTPVYRFHEDGLRVLAIPPARRRRRKPTDDAVYTPMETTMPQHPDVLFHPSSSGLSLKAASSHTTFGSQSDTESASDFRAASAPCDAVVRVCLICDCTASRFPSPNELIPSPCKCSLSWVHLNCLEEYREASGRNSKKHKQHQQLFLDLGQKDIGERTCSACGLLYMHGVESDDRAHAQYCKKLGQGIVISGWRSERVHRTLDTKAARIIEIRGDDSSAHVKKLLQIKSLLDDALGLVDEGAFLKQKHFVYLHQNRVVGVVSAEYVATGYELDSSSEIVSIDPSSQGHKVMVGVSHVWVHPSFRRQQIARALVDVMRQGFSYGMTIPTSKVAFSQPTNDGRLFAAQYCAPHPLLIYSS
ncbi:hypothetical protein DYB37_006863 [Aphanomyces astaci]|uniref:RING-CH-type domain-containing protein n=1 Tax=Aphanomyces astaci TaxID=112090 RepID=A0A3R7AI48_APHAT|nr:hypothetical protein DYB35_006337 [Aphanomyces astaci]RHZ19135.1 hypothetical protein DYB37_006863 [Aphanomyces astaci]